MTFFLQLSCFCLLTLFGEILGQVSDVVTVGEDSDAILPCSPSTKEDLRSKLFDWKKDHQREVFLYDAGTTYKDRSGQDEQFKGRVSHFEDELAYGNASIKIIHATLADSGVYKCIFPLLQPSQTFNIKLVVERVFKDRSREISGAVKPHVNTAETKDGKMLQCEVQGASTKPKVEWRDSAGNILHAEERQLTGRGGSYDIILKAKVTKTDNYRCNVTQEEISHMVSEDIYVKSGEASKPFVTTLKTEDGIMLQCVVQGASPKPKVEWRDGAGKILHAEKLQDTERGGSYDIIFKATVTKTDNYHCVVTQEEINHRTEAEIYVHLHESLTGWITGWFIAFVFHSIVLVAVVIYFKRQIRQTQKYVQQMEKVLREGPKKGTQQYKASFNEGQPGVSLQLIESSPDDSSPKTPLNDSSEGV